MAETQETPKKAAPKKAAPKKAAAPKAPSFSKEEMLEAINVAVQSAVKAAAPAPAPAPAPALVAEEKKVLEEAKYSGSENLVTVVATIFLVLGIIGSIVLVIMGIVSLSEYNSYSYYGGYHGDGTGAIIYGVVILFVSLLQFGMCKLYVNMSYRLTSIDKVLRAK